MGFGFHGKILVIDLAAEKTSLLTFNEEEVKKYFLGSGLAAEWLYERFDASLDALDERSSLLMFCGLLTGSPLPGTTKLSVCAKSPLTGIWNEATVGGHWPVELRKTGYDGLLITGRAREKVYLHITEEQVLFKPAGDLWGKDTFEVEKILRPSLDKKAKIATIGPAGENLSLISSIMFEPPISRVAARSGTGAVMGSKNLKAIVVLGSSGNRIKMAHPDELKVQLPGDVEEIRKNTVGLYNFGTSGGVEAVEHYGDLSIKNWQLGAWKEGAKKICGQTMQPMMLDHHHSCYGCPIRCGKIYRNDRLGLYGHGPEYETIGTLGALCLNDDPELLAEGNEWCNRYGIDTISTGNVIAFAIEAFEKGIINEKDTGGLTLRWGGESMVALVHKIGRNEGLGKILAQGVKRAAEAIGGNSAEFAVHTKGLEYPAHDPRGHVGMALHYATAGRGACHLDGLTYFLDRGIPAPDFGYTTPPNPHDSSDKPPIVFTLQNYLGTFNPLGMCKFLFLGRVGPKKIARWLKFACGWDFTMEDVQRTGERLFNLKRLYNVRLGISRKDDMLPPRLFAEAKPDGAAQGVLPDLGNMLYRYYQLRGWSRDGIPTPEKLKELELDSEVHHYRHR
ncbi:MAG: aldehyde ferredoxin oxidoreductase family protein [Candidatus Eremiobacteraeota bacterium]|nr:aldehyde ferredoxin oxidoreductase family protein [Candidatus Eremiobacteraeota bacterium]